MEYEISDESEEELSCHGGDYKEESSDSDKERDISDPSSSTEESAWWVKFNLFVVYIA